MLLKDTQDAIISRRQIRYHLLWLTTDKAQDGRIAAIVAKTFKH